MVPPLQASFRSRANYAVAWVSELGSPFLSLWAASKAGRRPPSPPQTWRKGLLLGANHIGDILYRSCSLPELTEGLPGCRWDMIAPSPASQALEGNPTIRHIHDFDLPRTTDDPNFRRLQDEQYDVAFCYDTGMYFAPLKLAVELGIPNRAGCVHKGFSAWVTHPLKVNYPSPFPEYFRQMVEGLTNVRSDNELRPLLWTTEADKEAARRWRNQAGLSDQLPLVAVFCSTRQPTGLWPAERFAEVAHRLRETSAVQAVFCGARADHTQLKQLSFKYGEHTPVLSGDLTLPALKCFLEGCQAVICPDSGPRHLANAAGVPVFFFRNLRSHSIETGVYCRTETDLVPFGEFLSDKQQKDVLQAISVDSVLDKIKSTIHGCSRRENV